MNAPALRFKEFNGEWAAKKLSDIASRIGDGLHSTPVYDESGDYYFINGNNLTNNKIEINESTKRLSDKEYLKHKIELSSQSILISINGTIGNLAFFNNEQVVLGKSACYINLKPNENKYFVFNLLQTSSIKSYFDKELTGSTIKNLSLTTIKNTRAFFPCYDEQTKIANFLMAVDKKITQLSHKRDLLAQYKKGLIQQIFKQELRFKNDDGQEYPVWHQKELGEISVKKSSNIAANKIEDNEGHYKIYGAAGILKKVDFYTEDKAYISIVKDGAGVGRVLLCDPYSSVLGTLDIIHAKEIVNISFLHAIFQQIDFEKYVTGSTIPHIYYKDYSKEKVGVPCLEEQVKIACFLNAIDEKQTQTLTQLAAAKQYKQGLLQQMFI